MKQGHVESRGWNGPSFTVRQGHSGQPFAITGRWGNEYYLKKVILFEILLKVYIETSA
jgi:hypothetical protein